MLLGYYFVKPDQKGRIALPYKFRAELGPSLVVARWFEKCLVVINRESWGVMVHNLTGGELATLSARDTDRFLLGGSFEVELDKQGRFVVPTALRSFAGIKGEVVIVGLGQRVEIWGKERWEDREKKLQNEAGEKVEKLYRDKRGKNGDE